MKINNKATELTPATIKTGLPIHEVAAAELREGRERPDATRSQLAAEPRRAPRKKGR